MKIKLIYSTLLSTALLLGSCTKEDTIQMVSGDPATLLLTVPSRSVGSGEDEIRDIRVVSVMPADASHSAGVIDVNGGSKAMVDPFKQTLHSGVRDVYVFANENSALTASIDAARSLDDLKRVQIAYTASLTPPFVSTHFDKDKDNDKDTGRYFTNVDIKKDANVKVEAKMVRTVSKVSLTLAYTWDGVGAKPLPEAIVLESVQVKNLPEYSYLLPKDYDGTTYTESRKIEGTAALDSIVTANAYQSKKLTLYIPEFRGATAADGSHAYIEIIGHLVSDHTTKCTYRMALSSTMSSDGTIGDSYNIERNTHFKINGTITGLGELSKIEIKATVADWNDVDSPSDVGEFLIVTETVTVRDIAETKFNVNSSFGFGGVEMTNSAGTKFSKNEYSSATGEIILAANRDLTLTEPTEIATLTLKNKSGKLTRTVKVIYEPIVWAPGDIVLSADNKYIIGEPTSGRTMMFQGGARCGVLSNSTQDWRTPLTRDFYDITTMSGTVAVQGVLTYVAFTTYSQTTGKGDPCKYIDADNTGNIASAKGFKWRSPTESEISLLLPFAGQLNPANGTVVTKNGIRGWQFNKDVTFDLFFPYQNSSGDISKDMIGYDQVGASGSVTVGYRWTNTQNASTPPQYYAILCDDKQAANPRKHMHRADVTLPVRCVRDFSRK